MSIQLTRIGSLKAVEGIASDVRQVHKTIISSAKLKETSYECLFRLSSVPVALRVNSPIFIGDGETVRVVGRYNRNGVFEALAYQNLSSGVSGHKLENVSSKKVIAIGGTIIGGIAILLGWGLLKSGDSTERVIGLVTGLVGLFLAYACWIDISRSRSEVHAIDSLLNDAQGTSDLLGKKEDK